MARQQAPGTENYSHRFGPDPSYPPQSEWPISSQVGTQQISFYLQEAFSCKNTPLKLMFFTPSSGQHKCVLRNIFINFLSYLQRSTQERKEISSVIAKMDFSDTRFQGLADLHTACAGWPGMNDLGPNSRWRRNRLHLRSTFLRRGSRTWTGSS